jgi:hypothetical protein
MRQNQKALDAQKIFNSNVVKKNETHSDIIVSAQGEVEHLNEAKEA